MKAVILAGGEGKRLQSIAGGLPKPMMPILGKPMLEHILLLLKEHGYNEICLSLGYKAEQIRAHFGAGERLGLKLDYRIEREALGTAGGVKNCMDFIGGEDFLVMSGDCACDFDLSAARAAHRGTATILLSEQDEPLPYGLVLTGRAGRITAFLEKPVWERVVTNLVSTGIYILSPAVMNEVPSGQSFDFAKDLFPRLLEAGVPLQGCKMDGFWCDIGTPRAYYECNLAALDGRYRLPNRLSDEAQRCVLPCKNRARLMRCLAEYAAEFGADFSDGLSLCSEQGRAHIAPLALESAIVIEGEGACFRHLADIARDFEAKL